MEKSTKYNTSELMNCNSEDCEIPNVCLDCLLTDLTRSPYAQKLHETVGARFGTWAFQDKQEWIKLMGDDMDPVKHGYHQALNVAKPFIEFQYQTEPFTQDEAKLLLIANVLHDAHEGITGDVAKPQKTKESDILEVELNCKVVADILGEELDSEFMQAYRGVTGDLEGWSRAGRAFSAIEWCGYFLSGVKAWSLRNNPQLKPNERLALEEMGRAVMTQDVPVLLGFTEFPYCAYLVNMNKGALDELIG